MNTEMKFEHKSFGNRLKSMMKVDFRRMFTSQLFYIMIGVCLIVPILILVMTTMMDGTVSVDPQTGAETVVEGFDNAWQIIGTVSGVESAGMSMDMTSMCNINLLYFAVAVLICLFVSEDFKSGYAKNLFTVRAKRGEYVASKMILFLICGAVMMLAFFAGAMLGSAFAGLPFTMDGFTAGNLILCVIAKIALIAVFAPIFLAGSVFAKQKTWLGIVVSCAVGMLLFMMIPMMTPLNATIMHAGMCLAGGVLFSIGLGAASTRLLKKRDLV